MHRSSRRNAQVAPAGGRERHAPATLEMYQVYIASTYIRTQVSLIMCVYTEKALRTHAIVSQRQAYHALYLVQVRHNPASAPAHVRGERVFESSRACGARSISARVLKVRIHTHRLLL